MTNASLKSPFHPTCLEGKVALVTGGGSGICYAVTQQLLSHGCSTAVILGRRLNFLQSSAAALSKATGKRVLYQACDVRDPEACMAAVKYTIAQCGKLDVLINGAAGNFLAEAKNLRPKGFKTVMEIDTMGTYNMCYAAHQYLAQSKGSVINISATLQYGATWYQVHASAAKSANDSMTRTLALEWGIDGIRVNGIAPGPIADTPGMAKLAPGIDGKVVQEMIAEGIPIGRLGRGFDIGMAAVFLSCDSSGGFITGDILVVDGGEWLYKPPMVEREMVAELSRSVEKKSRDMRPASKDGRIKSKL